MTRDGSKKNDNLLSHFLNSSAGNSASCPIKNLDGLNVTSNPCLYFERTLKVSLSFNYGNQDMDTVTWAFCNNIEQIEGGIHLDAALSAITTVLGGLKFAWSYPTISLESIKEREVLLIFRFLKER